MSSARVRAARPDIALSSDFIVGFPGETDQDAEATIDLIEKIGFAQAYSFKYSPRPGTPAAIRRSQIPESLKRNGFCACKRFSKASRSHSIVAALAGWFRYYSNARGGKRVNLSAELPIYSLSMLPVRAIWLAARPTLPLRRRAA